MNPSTDATRKVAMSAFYASKCKGTDYQAMDVGVYASSSSTLSACDVYYIMFGAIQCEIENVRRTR